MKPVNAVARSSNTPPWRRWLARIGLGLGMVAFVGIVVWAGMGLSHGPSAPARQIARIAILPDIPPPPPPPPPQEPPKAQPQEQPKQIEEAPKPMPPEPQQLKMEGAAGEGPSPFAAGQVKQDYIGGDIGNGNRYSSYIAHLEQQIQAELTRHNLRVSDIKLFIWLGQDGSIERYKIIASNNARFGRPSQASVVSMRRPWPACPCQSDFELIK
jgi:periplasmic protein TonB